MANLKEKIPSRGNKDSKIKQVVSGFRLREWCKFSKSITERGKKFLDHFPY